MICRISFLERRKVLCDILPAWIIHQATTIEFVILAADGVEIKYRTWLSQMGVRELIHMI